MGKLFYWFYFIKAHEYLKIVSFKCRAISTSDIILNIIFNLGTALGENSTLK